MRTTPILSGFQLVLICLLMFGQLHPAFADPIHDGAARGDVQAIEQALATGADINKRDDKGRAAPRCICLRLLANRGQYRYC